MPRSSATEAASRAGRSEEHTSELQSRSELVCRLLLEKKKRDPNGRPSARCPQPQARGCAVPLGVLLADPLRGLPPLLRRFFFNDPATTEISTLSLHDALPICQPSSVIAVSARRSDPPNHGAIASRHPGRSEEHTSELQSRSELVCRLLLEKKKKSEKITIKKLTNKYMIPVHHY